MTPFLKVITAKDNEKYVVWWPKCLNIPNRVDSDLHNEKVKDRHLWICVPGAMKQLSECMEALHRKGCFEGSDWCVFNQPGIGNVQIVDKPTPPPTDVTYLFEFIANLKNLNISDEKSANNSNSNKKKPYYSKISVIGFSMGGTAIIFLIDELEKYANKSIVNQIICVHSPELIRETFEHMTSNLLFRFDILCAWHVWTLNKQSQSWGLISNQMKNTSVFKGWDFMKRISEVTIGFHHKKRKFEEKNGNDKEFVPKWDKFGEFEWQWYNPRRFVMNKKVECVDLIRIVLKCDPIVPFHTIDSTLFENYYNVEVHENGGHCLWYPKLIESIKKYNQRMIEMD